MTLRSDDIKKQANELWHQAVDQLDEVKQLVMKQRGRIETDLQRMLAERDRLLKKLGEQTYKLANQGTIRVPKLVKDTVVRLNKVIDRITESPASGKRPRAKQKVTRRRVKKASAQ